MAKEHDKAFKGTLCYFQNVAVYFECVGVKRHKTMSKQEKMSAAARSYKDLLQTLSFGGWGRNTLDLC